MSGLISRLRSFLGMSALLRNKKDGIAFVKGCPEPSLNGRYVKTLNVDSGGVWSIEPELVFVLTAPRMSDDGRLGMPGEFGFTDGLHDSYLQPIGSPGEGERDESLSWLPVPPVLIPLKVKGEVS